MDRGDLGKVRIDSYPAALLLFLITPPHLDGQAGQEAVAFAIGHWAIGWDRTWERAPLDTQASFEPHKVSEEVPVRGLSV